MSAKTYHVPPRRWLPEGTRVRACVESGLLLFALLLPGCKGSTGPEASPGVNFLEGGSGTDTALANLPQWLLVEVRDSAGNLAEYTPVEFAATTASDGTPTMYVAAPETTAPFHPSFTDTTGTDGRAAVRVRYGMKAGEGAILVRAPLLALEDTAFYTVEPGAAASVSLAPADTAVYVAGGYTVRATISDRYGNPRTDAVTLTEGSDAVSLNGEQITGEAIGRAFIVGQAGALRDTAWVSVVPEGTLAASRNGGIATFALDGSGYHQLVPTGSYTTPGGLVWNPAGTTVLFNPDPGYISGQRLYTVGMDGQVARLTEDDSLFGAELWGDYTSDGTWVYFGGSQGEGGTIWRIHPDGSGLDTVPGLPFVLGVNNINPTPSPDGTALAYVAFLPSADNVIRVLDLVADTVHHIDVPGHTPRWAPNDDRIAFIVPEARRQGPIWIMHADGSGRHQISADGRSYSFGINWSPDGQWIVASGADTSRLELINATTGLTLPLAYSTGFAYPAWQPGG